MIQTYKKILVVLGMHRSGTSALTRGLQVLGVALGDNLMPAFEGNNTKGFWEDLEVVAINDAALAWLNMDWHSLGGFHHAHDWSGLLASELAERAERYLRQQTQRYPLFGLKDPRMARLLPFWREIFQRCAVEPVFLISNRNPLSVASSLAARDGFLPGKSYYLWLEHMLPSLQETAGAPRCVVSFDRLLEQPTQELARIAAVADLPMPAAEALENYRQSFLDSGLRHFQHAPSDLAVDPNLATEAAELYDWLERLAVDELSLDDNALSETLDSLRAQLLQLGPAYRLLIALNQHAGELATHKQVMGQKLEVLRGEFDQQGSLLQTEQRQGQLFLSRNATLQAEAEALSDTNAALQAEAEVLSDTNAALQAEAEVLSRRTTQLQLDTEAIWASSSWRLTHPLRWLSAKKSGLKRRCKRLFLRQAKRLYHALPARFREPCMQLGFRYFGILLRGQGPYEAWRLNQSANVSSSARSSHLAFQRRSLKADGCYMLESSSSQTYCYLPPRRTAAVESELASFQRTPLISIITPVYGVEPCYLEALIDSVERQWYPHWELIFVEDAGPNPATRAYLAGLSDERIKVQLCEQNGGISAASNIAISMASGEYLAFLDHDDELTPDALYELAKAINTHDPDFIYSDEDKIDTLGNFSMPFFKPGWSPDALMSIMYTCHLGCIRRSLVNALGGLRPDFDGAQDYDLVVRLSELTQRIHHIPKVLYHWRTLPTSTAAGLDAKPYACDASRRLKEEALTRRGLTGNVEPVAEMPGQFRVNYHPIGTPKVSIIIPSRDNAAVLRRCIDSILLKTAYSNYELVLIDNQSHTEDALAYFKEVESDPRVRLLRDPQPFNYSAINNFGAREAQGSYLLFLNDDTEVLTIDWLERLLGFAQLSHLGAVGAKLLFPQDGGIQHCGVLNLAAGPGHAFYAAPPNAPLYFGRNILEWNWLAVTGACLMIARSKFDAVGGFDEQLPVAYNDVDLCWRLHDQGWRSLVCNAVTLIHYESVSRGLDHEDPVKLERLGRERRQLYRKHPGRFMQDPYFNPNLHAGNVNFLVQNY
ncbi:MAG: glycosyltransferase [Pseudomonas sp.]|uniref:glycosyltransferase n=1 Tax=Pseudomonas sp. TaxID=306 RepID=UPI003BB5C790